MKKTLIGSVFMISGLITSLSLIITTALYLPNVTQWRGSRLWFTIFGASDLSAFNSLSVGVPFVTGLILFILGLIILTVEYFKSNQ